MVAYQIVDGGNGFHARIPTATHNNGQQGAAQVGIGFHFGAFQNGQDALANGGGFFQRFVGQAVFFEAGNVVIMRNGADGDNQMIVRQNRAVCGKLLCVSPTESRTHLRAVSMASMRP